MPDNTCCVGGEPGVHQIGGRWFCERHYQSALRERSGAWSSNFGLILVLVVFVARDITGILLMTCLGFFISILFPTLYAMAIEGLGKNTARASGILTMGFLGGTVIPVIQGKLADIFTIAFSFIIAIVAYVIVIMYVFYYLRVTSKNSMTGNPIVYG